MDNTREMELTSRKAMTWWFNSEYPIQHFMKINEACRRSYMDEHPNPDDLTIRNAILKYYDDAKFSEGRVVAVLGGSPNKSTDEEIGENAKEPDKSASNHPPKTKDKWKIIKAQNTKMMAGKSSENIVNDVDSGLHSGDEDGIMEKKTDGGGVDMAKKACPHCGSEIEESVLAKKKSLDKCLVCGEYFEDSITCSDCKTKVKREVLAKQDDPNICPVCDARMDGRQVLVSEDWKLSYSTRDIENFHAVTLKCKCGGIPPVDIDKFETLTSEQCKLKEGEKIECNEPSCQNVLTSDFIVIAKVIEPDNHTIRCPTCGSSLVSKIKLSKKIGAAALLDVMAVGYVSKTFQCQHCKFTW